MTGKVKWFNNKKGFGFITGDDSNDYFAHYSKILSGDNYKTLHGDDEVTFDVEETDKGTEAINIKTA